MTAISSTCSISWAYSSVEMQIIRTGICVLTKKCSIWPFPRVEKMDNQQTSVPPVRHWSQHLSSMSAPQAYSVFPLWKSSTSWGWLQCSLSSQPLMTRFYKRVPTASQFRLFSFWSAVSTELRKMLCKTQALLWNYFETTFAHFHPQQQ